MKLQRIQATDVRPGVRINDTIEPVTLFVGANDAGKSTRLGLIDLVLSGPSGAVWPVVGRSPDRDFWSRLSFDDGHVGRGLTGGTHTVLIDGRPVGVRAAADAIRAQWGTACTWSLSGFLALPASAAREHLRNEVLRATPLSRAEAEAMFDVAALHRIATLAGVDAPLPDDSVLTAALDLAAAAFTALDRAAKAAGADAKRDVPRPAVSGTVADWRSKAADLTAQIGAAEGQLGEIRGTLAARESVTRQLADATAGRQRAELDLQHLADRNAPTVDAAEASLAEAEAAHEAAAAAHAAATAESGRAFQATRTALDAVRSAEVAPPWLGAVERAVGSLALAATFAAEPEVQDAIEHALAAFVAMGAVVMVDGRPMAARSAPDLEHLRATHAGAVVVQGAAERRQATAARAALDAKQRRDAARAAVGAAAAHVAARRRCEEVISAYTADEARLVAELDALPDPSTAELDALLAALRLAHSDAVRNADHLSDIAAAEATRAEAQARRLDLEAARTTARELRDALRAAIGAVQQAAVEPIVARMALITEPALGARPVIDITGDGCDLRIHLLADDKIVPLATASQSQRAVFGAALAIAVRAALTGWRHVVIDDLNALDADRRTAFVAALQRAVDLDLVDNILLAAVADGWSPPDGVAVRAL